MIKFIGKIVKDGNIVAWKISENDIEYNIAYRALYHEFYFKPMIEDGYVFHNYDCDVTTPDGYALKDISTCDEYLSDLELVELIDSIESGMLEEKDIASYFSRDVSISYIDVKEPVNPSIKTRQELENYIDTFIKSKDHGINMFDVFPINAHASKDALYSIEEIVSNKDNAQFRFFKLFENLVLSSTQDIHKLESTYGVTEDDNSTNKMLKVLKGFFAWGVPGLRANITDIKFESFPTTSIMDTSKDINRNVVLKYGIKRIIDSAFFSEDCTGRDFQSLAGDPICDTYASIGVVSDSNSISSIPPENIGSGYMVHAYGYKNVIPRITITMLSDDGISATFVADCDTARLFRGSNDLVTPMSMFRYLTVNGHTYIPYSRIAKNGIGYIEDSVLISSYVKDMVKKSITMPKYKTSFELLTGIGVSPYYAPKVINEYIRGGIILYQPISDVKTFALLHRNCSDTFRDGFSSKILEKYGTGEEEFADLPIEEQVEYINEEISNLSSEGKYLVKPEIPDGMPKLASPEYVEYFDEYHDNEVGNVNFVLSVLNGEQNIGNLALGMQVDGNYQFDRAFNIIYGALIAARQDNHDISCSDFLMHHISEYIETSILFKPRNATNRGCNKDIINFKSNMAKEANKLIYVTKVFRENGNASLDTANRHYGFECIVFDKSTKTTSGTIYNSIYQQISNHLSTIGRNDSLMVTGIYAANILMSIALNKYKDLVPENGVYNIKSEITTIDGEKTNVIVKIGEKFFYEISHSKYSRLMYSSCYDFSENQFSNGSMKCMVYCVNAAITPWRVIPFENMTIPEYNLFINYFTMSELASNFPETVVERIKASSGKVFDCLRDTFDRGNMFPGMDDGLSIADNVRFARDGLYLERNEYEDLKSYMTRTLHDISESRKSGKAIRNTVLKSDIQYSCFKEYVYDDGVEEDFTMYEEFSTAISNRHITTMAPRYLTSSWLDDIDVSHIAALADSNSHVSITHIDFDNIPLDKKMSNPELCVGGFDNSYPVMITKGYLRYGNGEEKAISKLTEEDMMYLWSRKIAIPCGFNEFIIKTIRGLVKVGV